MVPYDVTKSVCMDVYKESFLSLNAISNASRLLEVHISARCSIPVTIICMKGKQILQMENFCNLNWNGSLQTSMKVGFTGIASVDKKELKENLEKVGVSWTDKNDFNFLVSANSHPTAKVLKAQHENVHIVSLRMMRLAIKNVIVSRLTLFRMDLFRPQILPR